MPVGIILIMLVEVARHAHCGGGDSGLDKVQKVSQAQETFMRPFLCVLGYGHNMTNSLKFPPLGLL